MMPFVVAVLLLEVHGVCWCITARPFWTLLRFMQRHAHCSLFLEPAQCHGVLYRATLLDVVVLPLAPLAPSHPLRAIISDGSSVNLWCVFGYSGTRRRFPSV